MKESIAELALAGFFGVSAIIGFTAAQSKQPYDLTQIQFCPKSANGIVGQVELDKRFCYQPRYVLAEAWKQYGGYNSPIPYKGDAIQLVRELPTDNPKQIMGGAIAIVGLWGVTGCLIVRTNRLKHKDYELGELEKTSGYITWNAQKQRRSVKAHSTQLRTDQLKDGLSALDVQERQELGLTDEDNERAKARIQLEDYLKARAVNHSVMDKQIAENLRDKAKADQEREKIEGKNKSAITDDDNQQSVNQQRANELIEALKAHEDCWLWKIIDNLTPLWLIGRQGSGKTYTSAAIALVRKHCLGIPIYYLIDRHATGDNQKAWQYLDTTNIAESEEEIDTALDTLCNHWLLRIKGKNDLEQPALITPEQVLIDEYTNLKGLDATKDSAEKFYKMHLTDTRKAKSHVIGITHNDTNASYPEGTQATREAGTILIQKFSANGKTPLPRVKIVRGLLDDNGEELKDAERTLPKWFNPEDIYNHFNGKPIVFDN
ncbi:MAG: hypothetical protein KME30_27285 [Iphinoe sp. HA4291-MV1]|nr:hypothetical protein [Iphinoe sp. HA4291-MV1]